ncbi:TIGR02391 family protein [Streptomyces rochei]|nr:TIGR02391 family protein [Streptomyces sp. CS207]
MRLPDGCCSAKYFAAEAFLMLRNVAAHEDEVAWSEQEALEHWRP